MYPDPGVGVGGGGYALYVGRLSSEKGIDVLLRAWETLGATLPLKIAGDGPLAPQVRQLAGQAAGVEWLGRVAKDGVLALMREATVLIVPSICYEMFPMVILEAFASGLPVIGSALGNTQAIIDAGRTGLHFCPGDADDLRAQVEWLVAHPAALADMRRAVRAEYEMRYTAQQHHDQLLEVYRELCG
jgi:glycosyltransferase involved in cell wall biosynthesis